MTDEMVALRAVLEKSPDADMLREMIGFAAERLMELEVRGLTGAEHGDTASARLIARRCATATVIGIGRRGLER